MDGGLDHLSKFGLIPCLRIELLRSAYLAFVEAETKAKNFSKLFYKSLQNQMLATSLMQNSSMTYLIGSDVVCDITIAKGNKQLREDVLCKIESDRDDRGFVIVDNILKSRKNY